MGVFRCTCKECECVFPSDCGHRKCKCCNHENSHNYPDEELSKRILKLAEHDCCNIEQIKSDDKRCLQFSLAYVMEGFFRDMLEVQEHQAVGWFIKSGILNVYRSHEEQMR